MANRSHYPYTRALTHAERLDHPWEGVLCPACNAAPGLPCVPGDDGKIHGQRTRASLVGYTDPRPRAELPPRRLVEQLADDDAEDEV
jgi:hypothetical protein